LAQHNKAHRFGGQEVFFIANGANWIRSLKDNYFPEAIGILDIWHLEEELKKALGKEKRSAGYGFKGISFKREMFRDSPGADEERGRGEKS
jgi:hypothetical protein